MRRLRRYRVQYRRVHVYLNFFPSSSTLSESWNRGEEGGERTKNVSKKGSVKLDRTMWLLGFLVCGAHMSCGMWVFRTRHGTQGVGNSKTVVYFLLKISSERRLAFRNDAAGGLNKNSSRILPKTLINSIKALFFYSYWIFNVRFMDSIQLSIGVGFLIAYAMCKWHLKTCKYFFFV